MPRSIHHYVVYIIDEGCYGVTLSVGAHASLVRYQSDGLENEIFIPNEELLFLEDIAIGIEEEDI